MATLYLRAIRVFHQRNESHFGSVSCCVSNWQTEPTSFKPLRSRCGGHRSIIKLRGRNIFARARKLWIGAVSPVWEKMRAARTDSIESTLVWLSRPGNRSEAVRERLMRLEEEEQRLLSEINGLADQLAERISVRDVSQAVTVFILNFDKKFEGAPIEERKLLVRKCISQIIVDREKSVVRFYVRRIPAATQWIEDMLQKKTTAVQLMLYGRPVAGAGLLCTHNFPASNFRAD